ncbi:hypothetical protein FKP32DRAFT_750171 [Trametes sanguinea]|nr:hypothetical protein FKP32DRAFT_750171 [Trametes sanguinea]
MRSAIDYTTTTDEAVSAKRSSSPHYFTDQKTTKRQRKGSAAGHEVRVVLAYVPYRKVQCSAVYSQVTERKRGEERGGGGYIWNRERQRETNNNA